nr:unnamed protein product [Callosobruchus chinensis]
MLNVRETVALLEHLGFINDSSKDLYVFGFSMELNRYDHICAGKKVRKMSKYLKLFLAYKKCGIRELSRLTGNLVSVCPGVKYGYLYTKLFEREKCLALMSKKGNYNSSMLISDELKSDINWWIENLAVNKNVLTHDKYVLEIISDASDSGWGIYSDKIRSHEIWSSHEKNEYINYKELLTLDLDACTIDAFTVDWRPFYFYALPPFAII